MKTYDIQSVLIDRPARTVSRYIAEPTNLPKWTHAFARADAQSAELVTPNGAITIKLETFANNAAGTVDWKMDLPDGSVGRAFSRVTPEGDGRTIYSFVLMAPPVPLEALEGALSAQINVLAGELKALKAILET